MTDELLRSQESNYKNKIKELEEDKRQYMLRL